MRIWLCAVGLLLLLSLTRTNSGCRLPREDAYVLCSLAGDLKIVEIVDAGVWNVAMTMPLSVLSNP